MTAPTNNTTGSNFIENSILRVELDENFPVIRRTLHKPSGVTVNGLEYGELPSLVVNQKAYPLQQCSSISSEPGRYILTVPDESIQLTFTFHLDENEIVLRLEEVVEAASGRLKTLYFDSHSLVSADSSWKYYRRRHVQTQWDSTYAKGLWFGHTDTGLIGSAVPDHGCEALSFACFWNSSICVTARASFIIKPVELILEDAEMHERASRASMQAGVYHYRASDMILEPFEFHIAFLSDTNGDDQVDYNDAALWYRRSQPEPNPIYGKSMIYKILCQLEDDVFATFDQCLEIIKLVHTISDDMPQIVYVVGWQYDGHDTGYPSLDRVNEKLGGCEKLLWLIDEAKSFNATVSCHINVDDAYPGHPGWDSEIIGHNPDGSLTQWEVFNGQQSYHINHTKDVRSGKLFNRLDTFLSLVPIERSVHLDAFRFTNESWEDDEHIGMTEELELGFKPILEYFRSKGIDPTCEAVGYCPGDVTGLFSCAWYITNPLMQFGKLIGGGKGDNLMAWASGASTHSDFMPSLGWGEIADIIYLGTKLYHLYLTRELLDYRTEDGRKLQMRFEQGGLVIADADNDTMFAKWGDIEIARDYNRFIPVGDDLIYAYSRGGGDQTWTLPDNWAGCEIESHTISPNGIALGPIIEIKGREISFTTESQRPIRLKRIKSIVENIQTEGE